MIFKFLNLALVTLLFSCVWAQMNSPCTPTMMSSFSPCMNFLTNGSGAAPSADCCSSLRSLMTNGKDCLCQLATGTIPFRFPINQTSAISLPRSCNMPRVPLQCRAAGAPALAPAPGPDAVANGPSISPNAIPSPNVQDQSPPEPLSPGSTPGADANPTPPATTGSVGPTTSNTGSRAGVTPSAAAEASRGFSHVRLFMGVFGALIIIGFKF